MAEAPIEEGWVVGQVAAEFPELRLRWIDVAGSARRPSPEALQERLHALASRFHGAQALTMRTSPIPLAYRTFFRGIGLDPDATRTPIEVAAFNRLLEGGYTSYDRLSDALLLGLIETGVPLWAVDAEKLDGPLGIRQSQAGERLGHGPFANDIPPGRLIVADAEAPVGILFGALAPPCEPTPATQRLRIFTIQVDGVPELHVEEALWMCEEALDAG
jgi:DNA/RNA-binding domain of Phe-tRNA-synthetase-like protein